MDIDFKALFASSPNPYVVLDTSLSIVWMNDAYLRATMRVRNDILARSIFEAFPSEPGSESHETLRTSFERVIATGTADELALIRYDIHNQDGSLETRYWSATNSPVKDHRGDVAFILQHTVDVTELQTLRALRDEMGVVQRAEAVQARNRGLSEETERLHRLLDQAPGFVAVLGGPEHIFQMANRAYQTLVGQRDLIGKRLAVALPEIVDQGFIDLLDQVHRTARAYIGRREKVALLNQASGQLEERFLDFIYQPILSDDGTVSGVFVQGHDVSEQVAAEEQQELLINELNHRVKNTLAIVQGLARQSFRNVTDVPSGLNAFSARLSALAVAHNLLTQENWEAARLSDVLQTGLEATVGMDSNRISLEGPDVTLSPQTATSVAMVIHELSTNAIKYGALSTREGVIEVNWRVEDVDDIRRLTLTWKESGGPAVDRPTQRGFGMRLIERGFASELRSTVEMDFRPQGLHCIIDTAISQGRP